MILNFVVKGTLTTINRESHELETQEILVEYKENIPSRTWQVVRIFNEKGEVIWQ